LQQGRRNKEDSGCHLIKEESINKIFNWTRLHTYYVQYVCNHLYEKGEKAIREEQVNNVFHQIITDFEPQYINYRNLLPAHQFRLLKAIAVEDVVTQPTSGNFIAKNALTSPSSVSTSLKALSEKEMIVYDRDRWQVYDVFLQDGLSIITRIDPGKVLTWTVEPNAINGWIREPNIGFSQVGYFPLQQKVSVIELDKKVIHKSIEFMLITCAIF